MKATFGVLALCVSAALCSDASAGSKTQQTPDGRFGTRCYSGEDGDLCNVSFYQLLSRSEKYDGKRILIRGFLVKLFGDYVLFPSRQSFESGADIEGIELLDKFDLADDIASRASDGVFPVVVVGVFDARYAGISHPRLGALRKIAHVLFAPRMID